MGAAAPNRYRGGGGRYGSSGYVRRDDLIGSEVLIHGKSYYIESKLGAGGFGAVYRAQAPNRSSVAIKVIDIHSLPGAGHVLVESYLNEVKNLQRLTKASRHVVLIYDFDFDHRTGRAYIVMELGDGNLTELIERVHATMGRSRGPGLYIDPGMRKGIWRQMVSIIDTLHANNMVHMDLKPDNLILFGKTLKIADLGISKKADVAGQGGVGTPYYSAPEIMEDMAGARRYYGPKADIWSLGAILYYMTYGTVPRYHPRAAEPPPGQPPARDPMLVDVLRRTLLKDPHARLDIRALTRHAYTTR